MFNKESAAFFGRRAFRVALRGLLLLLIFSMGLERRAFAQSQSGISLSPAELQALRAELLRAKEQLSKQSTPAPYELRLDLLRGQRWIYSSSFGARVQDDLKQFARGRVEIWVGREGSDNQGFLSFEDGSFELPLRAHPELSRRQLWRALDRSYRASLASLAAKRAALSEIQDPSAYEIPRDKAPSASSWPASWPAPLALLSSGQRETLSAALRAIAAEMKRYPELEGGELHWSAQSLSEAALDSQGLSIYEQRRTWNLLLRLRVRAKDGMPLDHAIALHGLGELPDPLELLKSARTQLAQAVQDLVDLSRAPLAKEGYDGPVLLSPAAAAALLASSVALHAGGEPPLLSGYGPILETVGRWQSRVNQQVMTRGIDLVDLPQGVTRANQLWPMESTASPAFAAIDKDAEGYLAQELDLVRDGILQSLFMTRVGNRYQKGSRARARKNAALSRIGGPSHLRLGAKKSLRASSAQLRKELLRRASEDGYDYAYIIESFRPSHLAGDPPRASAQQLQDGRNTTMPLPFLVKRVEPSGKEELQRGLMVAPMSLRVLRRIRRVGRQSETWANRMPLGVSGGWAAALEAADLLDLPYDVAISTPSLLIDGLELWTERGEQERIPVLPKPKRVGRFARAQGAL